MISTRCAAMIRPWAALVAVGALSVLLTGVAAAETDEDGMEQGQIVESPRFDDDRPGGDDRERRSLQSMSRSELEEAGFSFEDPLEQQHRAHATVFALLPGTLLTGAGHWHMDDSQTALRLLSADLVALALLTGGLVLALRPTGLTALDERRRDLWFLGAGTMGTTWLIDVFGTAYRDDLGIPASTKRTDGWGLALNYRYWRPRELSLRHVAEANLVGEGRRLAGELRTAQELGLGMSDYEASGTWFPFIGLARETRAGLEVSTRYLQYRLDEPFHRGDVKLRLHLSLDLGRLSSHLERLVVGTHVGVGWRAYRFRDDQDRWSPFRYGGWTIPLRTFLALNLTEQLRLEAGFERGEGDWLEANPRILGLPTLELAYGSTERIDLRFFARGGHGLSLGAGMLVWFGE